MEIKIEILKIIIKSNPILIKQKVKNIGILNLNADSFASLDDFFREIQSLGGVV